MAISRSLTSPLFVVYSLREAVLSAHPNPLTLATFRQGSLGKSPIDGIWVSQDLPVASSSWCAFQVSPGDHHAGIIDLDLSALIGKSRLQIIQPKVRQLTGSIPSSHDSYNLLLLESSQQHLLLPKLHALFSETALPNFDWNSFGPRLEALDTLKPHACSMQKSVAGNSVWARFPFPRT